MLRKIETRELITTDEARKRYRNYYIFMEIVKVVDGHDNDLGYVLYTADKERDKRMIPLELFNGELVVASMPGDAYEPFGQVGNIVFHGEN